MRQAGQLKRQRARESAAGQRTATGGAERAPCSEASPRTGGQAGLTQSDAPWCRVDTHGCSAQPDLTGPAPGPGVAALMPGADAAPCCSNHTQHKRVHCMSSPLTAQQPGRRCCSPPRAKSSWAPRLCRRGVCLCSMAPQPLRGSWGSPMPQASCSMTWRHPAESQLQQGRQVRGGCAEWPAGPGPECRRPGGRAAAGRTAACMAVCGFRGLQRLHPATCACPAARAGACPAPRRPPSSAGRSAPHKLQSTSSAAIARSPQPAIGPKGAPRQGAEAPDSCGGCFPADVPSRSLQRGCVAGRRPPQPRKGAIPCRRCGTAAHAAPKLITVRGRWDRSLLFHQGFAWMH